MCYFIDMTGKLDVITHNHLVNAFCRAGCLEEVDCLIKEMLAQGPLPNYTTFNTFIRGHCLKGDIDKALSVFSSMAQHGIKPNRITCNILLHALSKEGLVEGARNLLMRILSECEKKHIDLITSTILMDGYFKNGDVVEALHCWIKILHEGT